MRAKRLSKSAIVAAWVMPCVGSLLLVAGCTSGAPLPAPPDQTARPGDVVTVERGALRQILLLSGELRALTGAAITVPASPQRDPAIRWMAEEGTYVEDGDRMVELDTSQIATQLDDRETRLEEAINELNGKDAEIAGEWAQKEFEVEEARIALRKAEIDASIPEEMQSQREFQEFQLALEQARTGLAKSEADFAAFSEASGNEMEVLQLEVQMAEREVDEVLHALETMELRAPRAGIVVAGDNRREGRKFQVGDTTWVGANVMEVPDLSVMMVDTRMSDVDDGKITPGMAVLCTMDAYPELSIAGVIRSITPVAQGPTNQRSNQRFFRIFVDLEESYPDIMRPGMSVMVEVVTASRADELLVPRTALEFDDRQVFAVLENGELQAIELGPCSAFNCVVVSGLREGARLLTKR